MSKGGILGARTTSSRAQVAALARAATGGLIDTGTAASAWNVPAPVATSRLHRLVAGGWLSPVRRGVFLVLPLDAASAEATTAEDPWLVASTVFAPSYVGGWSAAEHWGLTEQTFRSIFVVTAMAARARTRRLLGQEFRLVRVPSHRVETVSPIWRNGARLRVSSRERTISDGLQHPEWVGGVRHLADMFRHYRDSEHWKPAALLSAMAEHPRGAAYKRLGHLVDVTCGGDPLLTEAALRHRTQGLILLDPSVRATGTISTRWGLRLNVSIQESQEG